MKGFLFQHRGFWWCAAGLVLALPALLAALLPPARVGLTLQDFIPVWFDEVYYWHQAASFREVGFNSGYYTYMEQPARAAFARYFAWGLGPPVLYGVPAMLLGWDLNVIPFYNIAFITIGLGVFLLLARPALVDLLLLGLILVTFFHTWIYLSTSLLPVMEAGMTLGLAGGIIYYFQHGRPRRVLALLLVTLALYGLIRATWALLAFPLLLAALPRPTLRGVLLAIGGAALLNALVWGFVFFTAAPYPNLPNRLLSAGSLEALLDIWGAHVQNNLYWLRRGDILEIHLRGQVALMFIILTALIAASRLLKRFRLPVPISVLVVALVYLLSIMIFSTLLYDTFLWRDYRLLAPALLLTILLLIAHRQRAVVLIMLATSLWILPDALKVSDIWQDFHHSPSGREAFYAWRAEMVKVVAYDPDAPSAWCNTVSTHLYYLHYRVIVPLGLDAGLGISYFDEQPPLPFKARWLLLDDATFAQYQDQLNAERLMTVPDGALYRNLDSACPD